ncbi:MAG: hypothetical protein H6679_04990 [Epsilonproteobacteria bacterium]|nr:hypothetical protein [Campylobacterota bacterium]
MVDKRLQKKIARLTATVYVASMFLAPTHIFAKTNNHGRTAEIATSVVNTVACLCANHTESIAIKTAAHGATLASDITRLISSYNESATQERAFLARLNTWVHLALTARSGYQCAHSASKLFSDEQIELFEHEFPLQLPEQITQTLQPIIDTLFEVVTNEYFVLAHTYGFPVAEGAVNVAAALPNTSDYARRLLHDIGTMLRTCQELRQHRYDSALTLLMTTCLLAQTANLVADAATQTPEQIWEEKEAKRLQLEADAIARAANFDALDTLKTQVNETIQKIDLQKEHKKIADQKVKNKPKRQRSSSVDLGKKSDNSPLAQKSFKEEADVSTVTQEELQQQLNDFYAKQQTSLQAEKTKLADKVAELRTNTDLSTQESQKIADADNVVKGIDSKLAEIEQMKAVDQAHQDLKKAPAAKDVSRRENRNAQRKHLDAQRKLKEEERKLLERRQQDTAAIDKQIEQAAADKQRLGLDVLDTKVTSLLNDEIFTDAGKARVPADKHTELETHKQILEKIATQIKAVPADANEQTIAKEIIAWEFKVSAITKAITELKKEFLKARGELETIISDIEKTKTPAPAGQPALTADQERANTVIDEQVKQAREIKKAADTSEKIAAAKAELTEKLATLQACDLTAFAKKKPLEMAADIQAANPAQQAQMKELLASASEADLTQAEQELQKQIAQNTAAIADKAREENAASPNFFQKLTNSSEENEQKAAARQKAEQEKAELELEKTKLEQMKKDLEAAHQARKQKDAQRAQQIKQQVAALDVTDLAPTHPVVQKINEIKGVNINANNPLAALQELIKLKKELDDLLHLVDVKNALASEETKEAALAQEKEKPSLFAIMCDLADESKRAAAVTKLYQNYGADLASLFKEPKVEEKNAVVAADLTHFLQNVVKLCQEQLNDPLFADLGVAMPEKAPEQFPEFMKLVTTIVAHTQDANDADATKAYQDAFDRMHAQYTKWIGVKHFIDTNFLLQQVDVCQKLYYAAYDEFAQASAKILKLKLTELKLKTEAAKAGNDTPQGKALLALAAKAHQQVNSVIQHLNKSEFGQARAAVQDESVYAQVMKTEAALDVILGQITPETITDVAAMAKLACTEAKAQYKSADTALGQLETALDAPKTMGEFATAFATGIEALYEVCAVSENHKQREEKEKQQFVIDIKRMLTELVTSNSPETAEVIKQRLSKMVTLMAIECEKEATLAHLKTSGIDFGVLGDTPIYFCADGSQCKGAHRPFASANMQRLPYAATHVYNGSIARASLEDMTVKKYTVNIAGTKEEKTEVGAYNDSMYLNDLNRLKRCIEIEKMNVEERREILQEAINAYYLERNSHSDSLTDQIPEEELATRSYLENMDLFEQVKAVINVEYDKEHNVHWSATYPATLISDLLARDRYKKAVAITELPPLSGNEATEANVQELLSQAYQRAETLLYHPDSGISQAARAVTGYQSVTDKEGEVSKNIGRYNQTIKPNYEELGNLVRAYHEKNKKTMDQKTIDSFNKDFEALMNKILPYGSTKVRAGDHNSGDDEVKEFEALEGEITGILGQLQGESKCTLNEPETRAKLADITKRFEAIKPKD